MITSECKVLWMEIQYFSAFGILFTDAKNLHPTTSRDDYIAALAALVLYYIEYHTILSISWSGDINGFNVDGSIDAISEAHETTADNSLVDVLDNCLEYFNALVSGDLAQQLETAAWMNHMEHMGILGGNMVEQYGEVSNLGNHMIDKISQYGMDEFFK